MSSSSNGFDSTSQNGFLSPAVHNHQYAFQQTDSNGYHTATSYTNLSPASISATNSTLHQPGSLLDLNSYNNDYNAAATANTVKSSTTAAAQYLNNSTNFHHRYPQYLNHHFELGNYIFNQF
jgi:hypothetical protein